MNKMIRCRACGYVAAEQDLGERCPACGAARTAFEPYTYPMGEKRRRLLNLQLHPIAVHFPTTLSVGVLLFSVGAPCLPGQVGTLLLCTTQVMALFLPLVVLLAVLAGLLDGKIRFRHLKNSQVLKVKIVFGIIFFVLACALALTVWLKGFQDPFFASGAILLAAGCVACAVVLGLLGTSILNAAFPGE